MLGFVIVSPLLLFDAVILTRSYQAEHRRSLQLAEQFAVQLESIISATLEKNLSLLHGLSASNSLARGDLRAFYEEAKRLSRSEPSELFCCAILRIKQFLNTQVNYGQDLPPAIQLTTLERSSYLMGKAAISGVYRSPISGEPRFAVALPLPDKGMILSVTLPTSYIRDAIQTAIPRTWIATVGDQDGIMLARSEKHDEVTGKPANKRFLELVSGSQGSFEVANFEGVELISGYVKSKLSGWLVAANIPHHLVAAPYRKLLLSLSAIALASLFLSITFAFLLGRLFAHDTSALTSQAGALALNKPVPPADIRLTDLSLVGKALVQASESIHAKTRERELLANELNHRVKNTLASIQAIAYQTIRDNKTPAEARDALSQRLLAMSRAHDILTRRSWHSAEISEVIEFAVQGFGGPERIFIEPGHNVRLRSSAVLGFSLVLHELATNAVKYGSLSGDEGTVDIHWRLIHGSVGFELHIEWRELGGPKPTTSPKAGFGTRLIQATFADMPGASTQLTYLPAGLTCFIIIPEAGLILRPEPKE